MSIDCGEMIISTDKIMPKFSLKKYLIVKNFHLKQYKQSRCEQWVKGRAGLVGNTGGL